MKSWTKPEVKIFGVKMDENIAASGDDGYVIRQLYCQDTQEDEWGIVGLRSYYVNGDVIVNTACSAIFRNGRWEAQNAGGGSAYGWQVKSCLAG